MKIVRFIVENIVLIICAYVSMAGIFYITGIYELIIKLGDKFNSLFEDNKETRQN